VNTPYDAFAWFYDRYWAPPFQEWEMPALDRLLFPDLSDGRDILDLCCGTGHLAQQLISRGYKVTGVDASREMLRVARSKVPAAEFHNADATSFALERQVDAAVCAFDSLNHLTEADRVELAFRNVHAALKPGGCFVFDVNTREAYGENWRKSACAVEPGHAFFLRGAFDPEERIGTTRITMFRLADSWHRADVEMRQRAWEIPEIRPLLRRAGFSQLDTFRASEDLGMEGHYGIGRVYFRAYK
jgi:SAM-dependent methyltransferase